MRHCLLLVLALLCTVIQVKAHAQAETQQHEYGGFQFAVTGRPGWVEALSYPQVQEQLRGQSLHYIVVDNQIQVADEVKKYKRMVVKPLTESGIGAAAELMMHFSPDYQQLQIHAVKVIRDGKASNRLKPADVKLLQRETDIDRGMYDQRVTALLVLDDIRVGDLVEWEYTVVGSNPVLGDRFFKAQYFGWTVPVRMTQLRVLMPKGRPLHIKQSEVELAHSRRERADGSTDYRWQRERTAIVYDEGQYPAWYEPYPYVELSEYASWDEVRTWAEPLYEMPGELSAELRQRIDVIAASDASPEAKVLQVLKLAQDEVRYFGVEYGQNSHKPSDPNLTFSRRYGDCKDKTVLIVRLLKELGVEAYPALVSSGQRRGVTDDLPSPGSFDHVIAMAQIEGRRYWLDGTLNYQGGNERSWTDMSYLGNALLIDGKTQALVEIQQTHASPTTIQVSEAFVAKDYESPIALTVTTQYGGREANYQRSRFVAEDRQEVERQYLNYYARDLPGIELAAPLEIIDDPQANKLTVIERYQVEEFWELNEDEAKWEFSLRATGIRDHIRLPKTLRRKMPLALRYPMQLTHVSSLTFPEQLNFEADDLIEIEGQALNYQMKSDFQERTLTVKHQLKITQDEVQAKAVKKHVRSLRKVQDNWVYSGWVDHKPKTEKQQVEMVPQTTDNVLVNLLDGLQRFKKASEQHTKPVEQRGR